MLSCKRFTRPLLYSSSSIASIKPDALSNPFHRVQKTLDVGEGNMTAYIRLGNESVPADNITLKRLVLQGTNRSSSIIPQDS